MIPTRMILFDGVMLETPLIGGCCMEFAANTICEYPSYCGPGPGIGNAIVPENFYGTRCSVACHIHDVFRALADRTTYEEFDQSNEVFFFNMCRLIFALEKDDKERTAALHQAALYYHAVQNWGKVGFLNKERRTA